MRAFDKPLADSESDNFSIGVAFAAAIPFPLKAIACGEFEAENVTVTLPAIYPACDGE